MRARQERMMKIKKEQNEKITWVDMCQNHVPGEHTCINSENVII